MKDGRLLAAAALSCLMLLAWADMARAGVAFLPDEPLRATWSQLEAGKRIEVCNGTSRRLTRLTIRPTNFAFVSTENDRRVAEASSVITTRLLAPAIAPGSCAPLRLLVARGKSVDPGEYSGSLVLVASGAGVTRLHTIVTGPGKKPAQPTAVGAEDALSLHDVTPVASDAAATLLLRGVAEGEAPISTGQECGDKLLHEHCEHLGNLYQGSHIVSVFVRGKASEDQREDIQELPIALKYLGHPVGIYEGTLTLTENGVPHPIKLKVDFKDAWYCAVVALLIGVAIVLLLQVYEGRWRLKRGLTDRRDTIAARYKSAHAAGYPSVKADTEDLDRYLAGVDEAIKRYANSVVLLDTKSQAYVEIDRALKLAEADLRPLVDEDGLGRALKLLDHEIHEATRLLVEKQIVRVPKILSLATEPLATETVKVGEAAKLAERANALIPVVKRWRELTARVLLHAVWLKMISGDPRTQNRELSESDAQLLATAGSELFGVRQALFEEVTGADDLVRIGNSGRLESAVGRIVYLASRLNIQMPPSDANPTDYEGELWEVGYPAAEGSTVTDEVVAERSADVQTRPAEPVALPPKRLSLILFDAVALTITVAISIIAGLSAFYFGKSFGTVEDYLTVIFTATAVQVVSKAILEQLSVFAHDISPLAETKPAVVESVIAHT
jgi:hypothetical protein